MSAPRERGHDEGLNGAIAAVLRGERAAQGVTIDQLSELSSIPAVTIQRLLATRRAITMEALERLCEALGLSPVEVVLGAVGRLGHADQDLVARVLAGFARASEPRVVSSTPRG